MFGNNDGTKETATAGGKGKESGNKNTKPDKAGSSQVDSNGTASGTSSNKDNGSGKSKGSSMADDIEFLVKFGDKQ